MTVVFAILCIIASFGWYISTMFVGDDIKLLVARCFLSLFHLIIGGLISTAWLMRQIAAGKDVRTNEMIAKKEAQGE